MIARRVAKVDFHLHSWASNVTDYYAANAFAIPESYSDPIRLWHLLKARGMQLVTLTDHNSIDGVKAMLDAGLADVFMSAEMTTTFPEDGCNVHVTIANVTEAQFAEANRLRPNVYELIAWLDEQIANEDSAPGRNRIAYFMTHPLMSTQNRPYGREGALNLGHIEKMMLLCNTLEVRNGTRTRTLNELTRELVASLNRETIERLANRHDLAPKGPEPWRKGLVAGSDDHSGINPGRTWTEFPVASTRPDAHDVIAAIRSRATLPEGAHGGPVTLAHSLLKLLHDGRKHGAARGIAAPTSRTVTIGGPIATLLRLVFDGESVPLREKLAFKARRALRRGLASLRRGGDGNEPFEEALADEVGALMSDPGFVERLDAADGTDARIFLVVSTLVNRIFQRYAARIAAAGDGNVVCLIKEAVALVSSNLFVSLPYLISYIHQSSDRMIVGDVRKSFRIAERQRIVLVTDTLFDVNGVARTIRRMLDESRRQGVDFTVVTCATADEFAAHAGDAEVDELVRSGRLKVFPAVASWGIPQYQGLKIRIPPFLELMRWLQEGGFTKMQISTPGTVGVAGLLAAKILQMEASSTYHTCFPEYVENYTRDVSLEALTWKYMILFYHSVDEVVVPSKFVARLLHQRGLRTRKLLVLDRWVDTERFHPRWRDAAYWKRHGAADAARRVKFCYIGRVGVEKNLATLADAFRQLCARRDDAHLAIIGDGPFRAALEEKLRGLPVTFTGFLEGKELATAIASCDAKLFPSTTDTWGNAALEAQASGLPVVVSDSGGPQELMIDGVTGLRVAGRDPAALERAMEVLMDGATRARMAKAAREFVEINRVERPFSAIFDADEHRRRVKHLKKDAKRAPDGRGIADRIDSSLRTAAHLDIDDLELDLGPIAGRRS
jgi:glycosyltransferase involved in cell wall biosynthesis